MDKATIIKLKNEPPKVVAACTENNFNVVDEIKKLNDVDPKVIIACLKKGIKEVNDILGLKDTDPDVISKLAASDYQEIYEALRKAYNKKFTNDNAMRQFIRGCKSIEFNSDKKTKIDIDKIKNILEYKKDNDNKDGSKKFERFFQICVKYGDSAWEKMSKDVRESVTDEQRYMKKIADRTPGLKDEDSAIQC